MDLDIFMGEHIRFMITLVYYFIPAMVGSVLTTYIKHLPKEDEVKDKKSAVRVGLLMFFSALVPSIILATFHEYLNNIIPLTSLKIGIAFIFGCVGDETLEIITSLNKMLAILKILSKYIEGLKHLTNTSEEIVNLISDVNKPEVKEETSNKDDNKHSPPVEKPQSGSTQSYHSQFNDTYNDEDDYYVE